mmetsp:Transcript_33543/g.65951  ORF Transcript_33543/g.65951 Transcript_33543/m.65951 type:complete len:279 (-) Transcript_33543:61-897(-)
MSASMPATTLFLLLVALVLVEGDLRDTDATRLFLAEEEEEEEEEVPEVLLLVRRALELETITELRLADFLAEEGERGLVFADSELNPAGGVALMLLLAVAEGEALDREVTMTLPALRFGVARRDKAVLELAGLPVTREAMLVPLRVLVVTLGLLVVPLVNLLLLLLLAIDLVRAAVLGVTFFKLLFAGGGLRDALLTSFKLLLAEGGVREPLLERETAGFDFVMLDLTASRSDLTPAFAAGDVEARERVERRGEVGVPARAEGLLVLVRAELAPVARM